MTTHPFSSLGVTKWLPTGNPSVEHNSGHRDEPVFSDFGMQLLAYLRGGFPESDRARADATGKTREGLVNPDFLPGDFAIGEPELMAGMGGLAGTSGATEWDSVGVELNETSGKVQPPRPTLPSEAERPEVPTARDPEWFPIRRLVASDPVVPRPMAEPLDELGAHSLPRATDVVRNDGPIPRTNASSASRAEPPRLEPISAGNLPGPAIEMRSESAQPIQGDADDPLPFRGTNPQDPVGLTSARSSRAAPTDVQELRMTLRAVPQRTASDNHEPKSSSARPPESSFLYAERVGVARDIRPSKAFEFFADVGADAKSEVASQRVVPHGHTTRPESHSPPRSMAPRPSVVSSARHGDPVASHVFPDRVAKDALSGSSEGRHEASPTARASETKPAGLTSSGQTNQVTEGVLPTERRTDARADSPHDATGSTKVTAGSSGSSPPGERQRVGIGVQSGVPQATLLAVSPRVSEGSHHVAYPLAKPESVARVIDREVMEFVGRPSGPDGTLTADIRLHPRELGDVKIQVVVKEQNVDLRVVVESTEVKHLIQSGMTDLRNSMEEKGYTLAEASVFVSGERDTGAESADRGMDARQEAHRTESPQDVNRVPVSPQLLSDHRVNLLV